MTKQELMKEIRKGHNYLDKDGNWISKRGLFADAFDDVSYDNMNNYLYYDFLIEILNENDFEDIDIDIDTFSEIMCAGEDDEDFKDDNLYLKLEKYNYLYYDNARHGNYNLTDINNVRYPKSYNLIYNTNSEYQPGNYEYVLENFNKCQLKRVEKYIVENNIKDWEIICDMHNNDMFDISKGDYKKLLKVQELNNDKNIDNMEIIILMQTEGIRFNEKNIKMVLKNLPLAKKLDMVK